MKTPDLASELRETMLVDDDVDKMAVEDFYNLVRTARREAFIIAVALDRFLYDHDQPRQP